MMGNWQEEPPPVLPGGVKRGKEGLKFLGVVLGKERYQENNWDGMIEKSVWKIVQMEVGVTQTIIQGEGPGCQSFSCLYDLA